MRSRATRPAAVRLGSSKNRSRSQRVAPVCVLGTVTAFLPALPAEAGQASPPNQIKPVDLAGAPYELPPPPPPLSEQQYAQPVDLSGLPGIWPDEATTAVPGGDRTATEILGSATPLLADGSPNTDVFGLG